MKNFKMIGLAGLLTCSFAFDASAGVVALRLSYENEADCLSKVAKIAAASTHLSSGSIDGLETDAGRGAYCHKLFSVESVADDTVKASCTVDGKTYASGQSMLLYMFLDGNPADGPMKHSSCINSAIQGQCLNGKILGAAGGDYASQFKYTRCYDDQLNEDSLNYLITRLYNNILKRQPDADGLAYWKKQIRDRSATMEDVEAAFKDVAAKGTDTVAKPSAALDSTHGQGVLSGTAANVEYVTVTVMLHSADAAKRIPFISKVKVVNGHWSFQLPANLAPAQYDVTVYEGNLNLLPSGVALVAL